MKRTLGFLILVTAVAAGTVGAAQLFRQGNPDMTAERTEAREDHGGTDRTGRSLMGGKKQERGSDRKASAIRCSGPQSPCKDRRRDPHHKHYYFDKTCLG